MPRLGTQIIPGKVIRSGWLVTRLITTQLIECSSGTVLFKNCLSPIDYFVRFGINEVRAVAVVQMHAGSIALGVVVDGCHGNSNILLTSLQSSLVKFVNKSSTYDKLEAVVYVILLDSINDTLADDAVVMITDRFLEAVSIGYIQVIQEPTRRISTCSWRNRSADICSMALLRQHVAQAADYYLHVGDPDVDVAPNFIDEIKEFSHRESQRRRRGASWTLLDFGYASKSDLSGIFMRSTDVVRFSTYFSDFYTGNISMLLNRFLDIVSQRSRIVRRPALLIRRDGGDGDGSYLEKTWSDADDPPASIFSSMRGVGRHSVELLYASGGDYFRASAPVAGDWITLVFDGDVYVNRIKVQTGLPSGSYPILGGTVEASPRLLKLDRRVPSVLCADFVRVGEIGPGDTEFGSLQAQLWGRPTRCLRITVTSADENDVVFRQVAVYS